MAGFLCSARGVCSVIWGPRFSGGGGRRGGEKEEAEGKEGVWGGGGEGRGVGEEEGKG